MALSPGSLPNHSCSLGLPAAQSIEGWNSRGGTGNIALASQLMSWIQLELRELKKLSPWPVPFCAAGLLNGSFTGSAGGI
jgi:hypothetical protein